MRKPKDRSDWTEFKRELIAQVGYGISILPTIGRAMMAKLDPETGNVIGELPAEEQSADMALGRTAALNYIAKDLASGARGVSKNRLEILTPLIQQVYENNISPSELDNILEKSLAKLIPELALDDDDDKDGGMLN